MARRIAVSPHRTPRNSSGTQALGFIGNLRGSTSERALLLRDRSRAAKSRAYGVRIERRQRETVERSLPIALRESGFTRKSLCAHVSTRAPDICNPRAVCTCALVSVVSAFTAAVQILLFSITRRQSRITGSSSLLLSLDPLVDFLTLK